jgi:hypothetical protein
MPDTNPACRTAFRSTSEIVRHQIGTLSGITPECCPPSVRNPVRRGPDYAFNLSVTTGLFVDHRPLTEWTALPLRETKSQAPNDNEISRKMICTMRSKAPLLGQRQEKEVTC